MKKQATAIITIILLVASICYAGFIRSEISTSTGSITTAGGILHKVITRADRASTCTWNLYDYGAVTGGYTTTEQELIPTIVCTTTESASFYIQMDLNTPFRDGLYAVISSTGEMLVNYENK